MAKSDYVKTDFAGYDFNSKYAPDPSRYGSSHHGYKNDVEETLFYHFAVQGYDLCFTYKGKQYHFLTEPDYVAYCDENYSEEYQRFPDGNTALEQFTIEGKTLLELIDELEDVEPI